MHRADPEPERPDGQRERVEETVRPHREPPAPMPLRRAITSAVGPLLVALVIGTGFVAAYVGALHHPRPKDVPVGVVRGEQVAAGLLAAVRTQGRELKAVEYHSHADADRALDRRDVYAVLAGQTRTPGLTLTTASAAAPLAGELITRTLTIAAERTQVPLTVTDAVPVDPDDPRGVVPFYLAVGLLIGGYFGGIALSGQALGPPRTAPD
ncbi:hypothetical protein [Plantactinospora sp. B5E13]|uniref:hypothetical protein n=1 Tax=Plantactinospora sp. B5E13 TaxID=3153758 RepID=UPI00325F7C26